MTRRRPALALLATCLAVLTLALSTASAQRAAPSRHAPLSRADDAFLEELSKRTFMFFWEQADPETGIVRDRSRTDGSPSESAREIGSIASVGFGLSGLCIAAERGWLPREQVFQRARTTLRFFAARMEQERGWFFHFVNLKTGAREWRSELSSIDTALLLGGCADRAALLRERPRDRPRCRGHLPARGFHLDAGGRSRLCSHTDGSPNRDS